MGSFSYTCILTGVPITSGRKAVIIPMLPKGNWYDNSEAALRKVGKDNFCSNDASNVFFDESCFPIKGEYDDYGRLEEIVKDDNTAILEKFYGLSIEDIVSVLCDGRKDEDGKDTFSDANKILDRKNPRHMELLRTSITWMNGDVYEKLANAEYKDYSDKLDLGNHGLLLGLGFKYAGEDKTVERYQKVYEKDGLQIHSDGTWIHISNKESIYSLSDFKKYCKKKKVSIDITEMNKQGYYGQVYDYILPTLKKDKKKSPSLDPDEGNAEELVTRMVMGDRHGASRLSKLVAKISGVKPTINTVKDLYYEELINTKNPTLLRNNIIEWHTVKRYFYPLGRYLYPIGTSDQCGDFKMAQIALQAALAVTEERLKERGEDDEEDEEEEED